MSPRPALDILNRQMSEHPSRAVGSALNAALASMDPALTAQALSAGANPNGLAPDGSPWLWAALGSKLPGSLEVARALLEAGAAVELSHGGASSCALEPCCASLCAHPMEKIAAVLSAGADVNFRNHNWRSLPHMACERLTHQEDCPAILNALREAGADLNASERHGETPMDLAMSVANFPAIAYLWEQGLRPSWAEWESHWETGETLANSDELAEQGLFFALSLREREELGAGVTAAIGPGAPGSSKRSGL